MRYRKQILVSILFDTLFRYLFQVSILFDTLFRYPSQESILFDTSSRYRYRFQVSITFFDTKVSIPVSIPGIDTSDTNLTSLAYGWVGLSVRHMKSSLDSSVFNDEENIPGGKPILIQLHFILIYSAESMSLQLKYFYYHMQYPHIFLIALFFFICRKTTLIVSNPKKLQYKWILEYLIDRVSLSLIKFANIFRFKHKQGNPGNMRKSTQSSSISSLLGLMATF